MLYTICDTVDAKTEEIIESLSSEAYSPLVKTWSSQNCEKICVVEDSGKTF